MRPINSTERPEIVFGPVSPGKLGVYLRLPKMSDEPSSGHQRQKTEDYNDIFFVFLKSKIFSLFRTFLIFVYLSLKR